MNFKNYFMNLDKDRLKLYNAPHIKFKEQKWQIYLKN